MPTFYQICLVLRRLPWYYRLFIVLSSFVILEVPVAYLTFISKERSVASILFFSGVLAALLFQWKKAFAIQCTLLLFHMTVNLYIKGYSYLSIPTVITAMITNLFIIWTIGCLRRGWEMSEEATEKQKSLSSLKDQFIANVNHEMRSPLTGAVVSLDILRDSYAKLNEQEREMFLDQAIYACDELQRIADNILDAMRCDSDVSPPWIREFDLGHVVTDVLRHLDAVDHPIHTDISDGIIVHGDSQQVGQVVRNLLSNCFKFSPRGAPVVVQIWQDDASAYVCVQDKGLGIALEHIPLIFQKFSRLECDVAGPVRGIGLGLYICRRFIENMGGRIWVESKGIKGEGSTFYFMLPSAAKIAQKKIYSNIKK